MGKIPISAHLIYKLRTISTSSIAYGVSNNTDRLFTLYLQLCIRTDRNGPWPPPFWENTQTCKARRQTNVGKVVIVRVLLFRYYAPPTDTPLKCNLTSPSLCYLRNAQAIEGSTVSVCLEMTTLTVLVCGFCFTVQL